MTRRSWFELFRKIDMVLIVLAAIMLIIGVIASASMIADGALDSSDSSTDEIITDQILTDGFVTDDYGYGDISDELMELYFAIGFAVLMAVLIVALLIERLIFRVLAATQSTILLVIIVATTFTSGLLAGTVSIPIFYIIPLFLPKE